MRAHRVRVTSPLCQGLRCASAIAVKQPRAPQGMPVGMREGKSAYAPGGKRVAVPRAGVVPTRQPSRAARPLGPVPSSPRALCQPRGPGQPVRGHPVEREAAGTQAAGDARCRACRASGARPREGRALRPGIGPGPGFAPRTRAARPAGAVVAKSDKGGDPYITTAFAPFYAVSRVDMSRARLLVCLSHRVD